MSRVDAILWGAVLLGGIALSLWYGASWRAVARALDTARRTAEPHVRPSRTETGDGPVGAAAPTSPMR